MYLVRVTQHDVGDGFISIKIQPADTTCPPPPNLGGRIPWPPPERVMQRLPDIYADFVKSLELVRDVRAIVSHFGRLEIEFRRPPGVNVWDALATDETIVVSLLASTGHFRVVPSRA